MINGEWAIAYLEGNEPNVLRIPLSATNMKSDPFIKFSRFIADILYIFNGSKLNTNGKFFSTGQRAQIPGGC